MPSTATPPHLRRRQLLLAGAAGLGLAACGGGGDAAPPPGWNDRWTSSNLPFPLAEHAAVVAGDGSVLITGGSRGLGVLSDGVDRYDPATRSCTRIGSLRSGRSGHRALRLGDGLVLVVGGNTSMSVWPFAELADERSGAVSAGGDMVHPRNWHTATLLADGRALVTGGLGQDSAELWDPSTRRWRLVAARMAHDRQHHSATLLADGRVLLVGGYSSGGPYRFAELFDPRTESFAPLPGAGTPDLPQRYFHAAHRLADGSVLVLGGSDQGLDLLPQAGVLRIDASSGSITRQAALATPRTLVRSVLLPGDRLLLAGGQTGDPLASAHTAFYGLNGQSTAAALPAARAWHSLHLLNDGRVLALGGEDADGNLLSTACFYD